MNLRDNGFKVIIGQASAFKRDWDRAVKDGWVPGKTLFEIDEAVRRGTIIQMLVSDAAQRAIWPMVKKNLKPGDALYFSHGFSIAYRKQTGVVPPKNVDVIMVAPKGSGTSVRRNFLTGAGINSSFAVVVALANKKLRTPQILSTLTCRSRRGGAKRQPNALAPTHGATSSV